MRFEDYVDSPVNTYCCQHEPCGAIIHIASHPDSDPFPPQDEWEQPRYVDCPVCGNTAEWEESGPARLVLVHAAQRDVRNRISNAQKAGAEAALEGIEETISLSLSTTRRYPGDETPPPFTPKALELYQAAFDETLGGVDLLSVDWAPIIEANEGRDPLIEFHQSFPRRKISLEAALLWLTAAKAKHAAALEAAEQEKES